MFHRLVSVANQYALIGKEATFEIGSNSDLILENSITGNLVWTIQNFSKYPHGFLTFPTKFDMIEPILDLDGKEKIIIRMSMNPEILVNHVELGTSRLDNRIRAINRLKEAGYRVRNLNCTCHLH